MRTVMTVAALAVAFAVPLPASIAQTYKVGQDGVKPPVVVKNVNPRYTDDAKARGVQGVVGLAALVKADGTVANEVRVIKSLDEQLDQQAVIAMRQWTFKPGTKDGKAVDVEVNVEMTFTLR